jgi:hypothetical protein
MTGWGKHHLPESGGSGLPLLLNGGFTDALFASADLIKDLLICVQASQHIAINQPSIEADFIGQVIEDSVLRGVTEKYCVRERMGTLEKRIANPQQVFFGLFWQGFQRMYPGMDAKVGLGQKITLQRLVER